MFQCLHNLMGHMWIGDMTHYYTTINEQNLTLLT
jgi:hypothetical protein